MLNTKKVQGMLGNLETYVGYLHTIAQIPTTNLLNDPATLGGAKYYLQTAIMVCIDLGNHIISASSFRAPTDYRDIFTVLGENNILPADFVLTMRQMVGLRNRLAHLYWEIDDEQICQYLQTNLGDFNIFAQHVLRLL